MSSRIEIKAIKEKRFFDIGREEHFRPSYRVWLHPSVLPYLKNIEGGLYIEFPFKGGELIQAGDKTLVLKCGKFNIYDIYVPAGYRGEGMFRVVKPERPNLFIYREYASERGRLGISIGALIQCEDDEVVIEWRRTGRLYGAPEKGVRIYKITGEVENIDYLEL